MSTPTKPQGVIEAAHDEIHRLCAGGGWRMTIPVNERRDSDIILSNALRLRASLALFDPENRGHAEALFRLTLKTLPKVGPTHRDYVDALQVALREWATGPVSREIAGLTATPANQDPESGERGGA